MSALGLENTLVFHQCLQACGHCSGPICVLAMTQFQLGCHPQYNKPLMPITFGSADLDPIIMFSQLSITMQKELKVPRDQDVCLSAVRGSAQPGIRQVRESHLQACLQQPLSISSSAHPLHHGSVATSHFFWHSYLQAHRDGKYSSTLLFWLFFGLFLVLFCFLSISISVPIPHTVLRTDEAADLRSQ